MSSFSGPALGALWYDKENLAASLLLCDEMSLPSVYLKGVSLS